VPRAKSLEPGNMVTMRFSKVLLEKIDRFMRTFEKENPGLKLSRADAIRMLVTKGLAQREDLE